MESVARPAALPRHAVLPVPAAVALMALGIVYGDIGTSPLYALKQAVAAGRGLHPKALRASSR